MTIGASVGIAIGDPGRACADSMIRNADLALYAAKAAGRGKHKLYEPSMHSEASDRQVLENDLRQAIERGELWVAYQPIQDGGFRQPILLTSRRSLESWGGFGPSPSTSCPFPERGLRLKDQHAKDKSGTPSTSSTSVIRFNSRHGHFLGLLPLQIRLEELTATRISAAHGRLHTPGDGCSKVMQRGWPHALQH